MLKLKIEDDWWLNQILAPKNQNFLNKSMNIATRFWGWALLSAGLGLAVLAWAPVAQAIHEDSHSPTKAQCDDPSLFGNLTLAQQARCGANIPGDGSGTEISVLVQRVVSILGWVAGLAAIIVVLVQGLRMILSGGDSKAIASARNGIIYAIVGLAIAVAAPHLVGYILSVVSP